MKTIINQWMYGTCLVAASLVAGVGCGEDDDNGSDDDNEEVELITTLTLTFAPPTGAPVSFEFFDPDAGGSQPGTADMIVLDADTTYTLTLELTDEINDEDITEEIMEEDDEHQFFFFGDAVDSPTEMDGSNILVTVDYADMDDNGLPVGLTSNVQAGSAGGPVTDGFSVQLQHQPPVNDMAVKTANSGIMDGDTDILATFDIELE
ncbi:MAG: hypothetical protein ACFB9M_03750 [Myxococcota bacterium]